MNTGLFMIYKDKHKEDHFLRIRNTTESTASLGKTSGQRYLCKFHVSVDIPKPLYMSCDWYPLRRSILPLVCWWYDSARFLHKETTMYRYHMEHREFKR